MTVYNDEANSFHYNASKDGCGAADDLCDNAPKTLAANETLRFAVAQVRAGEALICRIMEEAYYAALPEDD